MKTKEKYNERNTEKQKVHFGWNNNFYPHPKEIWYVKLWLNVWREQDWKKEFVRPILVIKKIWNLYFCLPLTTKDKKWSFYYELEKWTDRKSFIILSQWRVLDKNRFVRKIWYASWKDLLEIKKLIQKLYT